MQLRAKDRKCQGVWKYVLSVHSRVKLFKPTLAVFKSVFNSHIKAATRHFYSFRVLADPVDKSGMDTTTLCLKILTWLVLNSFWKLVKEKKTQIFLLQFFFFKTEMFACIVRMVKEKKLLFQYFFPSTSALRATMFTIAGTVSCSRMLLSLVVEVQLGNF